MERKLLNILKYLSLTFIICIAVSGCGSKSDKLEMKLQSLENEQKSEKAPDALKQLEEGIESIFKELKGPSAEKENNESKQENSESDQDKMEEKGNKSEESSKEGGSEEKKSSEQEKQNTKEAQQSNKDDIWAKITPILNKMHYQWDNYMPMASQKGATKGTMDSFSKALNSLTNTIIAKNKTNTLLAASYLYAYIPDFYSLYKTKEPISELKRIRYYMRNSMLNALTANWQQAGTDLKNLKASWQLCKNIFSGEQKESVSKMDFSIEEFERVIKAKNQPLVDIKGRVGISNIDSLENEIEKNEDILSSGSSEDQSSKDKE